MTPWTAAYQFLCPWLLGKNTGVGFSVLLVLLYWAFSSPLSFLYSHSRHFWSQNVWVFSLGNLGSMSPEATQSSHCLEMVSDPTGWYFSPIQPLPPLPPPPLQRPIPSSSLLHGLALCSSAYKLEVPKGLPSSSGLQIIRASCITQGNRSGQFRKGYDKGTDDWARVEPGRALYRPSIPGELREFPPMPVFVAFELSNPLLVPFMEVLPLLDFDKYSFLAPSLSEK